MWGATWSIEPWPRSNCSVSMLCLIDYAAGQLDQVQRGRAGDHRRRQLLQAVDQGAAHVGRCLDASAARRPRPGLFLALLVVV